MGMLRAGVDLEFLEDLATEAVVRDHPTNSPLNKKFGTTRPHFRDGFTLLASDISGIAGVDLGILFITGEAHLLGVDDYDVVTTINM